MALFSRPEPRNRSYAKYVLTGLFVLVLIIAAVAVLRNPAADRPAAKQQEQVKGSTQPSTEQIAGPPSKQAPEEKETPEQLKEEKEIEQEINADDNPEKVEDTPDKKVEDNPDKRVEDAKPKTGRGEEITDNLKDEGSDPEHDTAKDAPKNEQKVVDDSITKDQSKTAEKGAQDSFEDEEDDDGKAEEETKPSEEGDAGKESEQQQQQDKIEPLNEADQVLPEEAMTANQTELLVENKEAPGTAWKSQANASKEENKEEVLAAAPTPTNVAEEEKANSPMETYDWKLCTFANAADYIPCLDNKKAIKQLKSTRHFEHRERHCPSPSELPKCLTPLPPKYQLHVNWPQSRNQIWYNNVPHPGLVTYKKDQNWVRKSKDLLIFPGGGTQFKTGVQRYIDFIETAEPSIGWGKHTRVVLDVGCGVASFGGSLFDKDVLAMSIAPKDEHEAQVQLALERGIPAMLAVMGTQRLVFPRNSFDAVHCARCRVHWHGDGGKLLIEVNRLLRPGGYFIWSAFPVYKEDPTEVSIWKATKAVTDSMCWKLLAKKKDPRTNVGVAIFQKPESNDCYDKRPSNSPAMCDQADNGDAAWYVPMQDCLHRAPEVGARGSIWPQEWSARLNATPSWLSAVPKGLFGKPAIEEFAADTEHWYHVIQRSYAQGLEIDWSTIRNIMDMKAGYGGFAAALTGFPVWVMNVVPVDEPDTLPIIYERGLIGVYHDWCESFSTYPRTYDLLHSDHLFSRVSKRCGGITNTIVEMDRMLRPDGWAIIRDTSAMFKQIEPLITSLHWTIRVSYTQDQEQLVAAQKSFWRPLSK